MRGQGMVISGTLPKTGKLPKRHETTTPQGTTRVFYVTQPLAAAEGRKGYQEYKKLYGKISNK
jgi:hypothetical protein